MAGGFPTGAGLDDAPFKGLVRASGRSTSLLETATSAGSVLTLSNIDEETDLKVAQNGSAYTPSKSKVIWAVVGWPMDAWKDQKLVRRKSAVGSCSGMLCHATPPRRWNSTRTRSLRTQVPVLREM